MAQGRFSEAEELFISYSFIAPDQANPHDSLGELLTVTGRYEEARSELENALAIKPDFCASYQHLLDIAVLTGEIESSAEILARGEGPCGKEWAARRGCHMQLWMDFFSEDYEAPWREERRECMKLFDHNDFLIHRMAALTGRTEEARLSEDRIRDALDRTKGYPFEQRGLKAISLHMKGFRRLAEGDSEGAVELLRKADSLFVYWGDGQAILKLYNRLHLAYAYERTGKAERAQRLIEEVREVNPEFVQIYSELKESLDRS